MAVNKDILEKAIQEVVYWKRGHKESLSEFGSRCSQKKKELTVAGATERQIKEFNDAVNGAPGKFRTFAGD